MGVNLRINGQIVQVSLQMSSDTRGALLDTSGATIQFFVVKDGVVSLDGQNIFDNDEQEVCQAIDELRFQAAEQDYSVASPQKPLFLKK